MGELRFEFPHAERMDPRVWDSAYITGIEGIPWQCHHHLDGDQFSIGRNIDESGKLNIVWPTNVAGNLCLNTTSLRISESAYSLPVELARGTVSRLNNQMAEWQRMGLRLPDAVVSLSQDALHTLLRALTARPDDSERMQWAQRTIDLAVDAAFQLTSAFADQALEARRASEGRLATLFGVALQPGVKLDSIGQMLSSAFNMFAIRADLGSVESASGRTDFSAFDQQIDWATRLQKKICVGPLVNFRRGSLPRWMVLLDEGFERFLADACQHARTVVERYRGRVHLWNCAAGLNTPSEVDWNDEEILRMAVALIETVRQTDERTPVLLTVDQPWSEYLRDDADGISPLHFADALIRAELGLSGIALELNFDLWPEGSLPRDPMEISRLIDRWAMLGLPLMVVLTTPTDDASGGSHRVSGWSTAGLGKPGLVPPEMILRLLLSKPSVHAVSWNCLSDQIPSAADSSGLWDKQGRMKPLMNNMLQLRRSFLH
jgi:hypothetical protein